MFKKLLLPLTVSTIALGSAAAAQSTTSNIIFVVDESGSMSGEQTFLGMFATDIDTALAGAGFTTRNYGLVGFGNGQGGGNDLGRQIDVGGAQFGDAAALSTATGDLVLSGGFEDGYSGIDFALSNYTVTAGSALTLVLVTDEDRDNGNSALTDASVLADLQAQGAALISIANIGIQSTTPTTGIATNGTDVIIQDGTTVNTVSEPFGQFVNAAGTTEVDYADLALGTTGGCVADLNQLRLGGNTATAFANAFLTCVVAAATGGAGATGNNAVVVYLSPYRDNSMGLAQGMQGQVRAVAMSLDDGVNATIATQGNQIDNMFGVEGLRGYALLGASKGSVDAFGDNIDAELETRSMTLGLDFTKAQDNGTFRFGGALSMSTASAKNDTMDVDTNADMIQLYSVWRGRSGLQISGDLQYGKQEHQSTRLTAAGNLVTGETEGDSLLFSLEAGKRIDTGYKGSILMPYAGVEHVRLEQDGYTESGGNVIAGYEQRITTGKLGMRFEMDKQTTYGMLRGEVDLSIGKVFNDDVTIGNGATVTTLLDKVDDTYAEIGINLGLEFANNSYATLQVGATGSEHYRSGNIGIGIEMKF